MRTDQVPQDVLPVRGAVAQPAEQRDAVGVAGHHEVHQRDVGLALRGAGHPLGAVGCVQQRERQLGEGRLADAELGAGLGEVRRQEIADRHFDQRRAAFAAAMRLGVAAGGEGQAMAIRVTATGDAARQAQANQTSRSSRPTDRALLRGGGIFLPSNRSHALGEEVLILLSLLAAASASLAALRTHREWTDLRCRDIEHDRLARRANSKSPRAASARSRCLPVAT